MARVHTPSSLYVTEKWAPLVHFDQRRSAGPISAPANRFRACTLPARHQRGERHPRNSKSGPDGGLVYLSGGVQRPVASGLSRSLLSRPTQPLPQASCEQVLRVWSGRPAEPSVR